MNATGGGAPDADWINLAELRHSVAVVGTISRMAHYTPSPYIFYGFFDPPLRRDLAILDRLDAAEAALAAVVEAVSAALDNWPADSVAVPASIREDVRTAIAAHAAAISSARAR